jgi:hypothetical protein
VSLELQLKVDLILNRVCDDEVEEVRSVYDVDRAVARSASPFGQGMNSETQDKT